MALQETLTTLEERVQGRTADLRWVNTQLHAAITRRQRAEATLARLSQQHQLILEASSEGIYGIDRQGKVTFINPAAAQMLGWEAEALHGQVMHDHMHHTRVDGTHLPWQVCPIRAVLQRGMSTRSGRMSSGVRTARLASTPGRGTTVTIEIQRADAGG
jgi:PAS domain-containing protein